MRVDAELFRHDPGQPGHFCRVVQHVLTVAGAVLQASHELKNVRVQVVQAEVERHIARFFSHGGIRFFPDLQDHFFDTRRMDAAIGDQPLNRHLGDLATIRIEARQDNRARRVVHDQVDARRQFERADVAALAPDDTALQIVAWQIDDRDGRFDGVIGRAPLDGLGDVVFRAVGRRFTRLGVEALQQVGRIVPGIGFHVLDEQFLGLLAGEAGDAFELALLVGHELLVLRRRGQCRFLPLAHRALARSQFPFQPLDSRLPVAERRLSPVEGLFQRGSLLAVLARLTFGVHQDVVRLFLCVEQRFLPASFGVALSVFDEAQCLLLGATDGVRSHALAIGHPEGEGHPHDHQRRDHVDQQSVAR